MLVATVFFDGQAWSDPFPALDSPQTLVTVFAAPEYLDEPEPIRELVEAFPNSAIVGCSSSGEIYQDLIHDGALSVAVTKFEHTELRVAVAPITMSSSRSSGRSLASELAGEELAGVFVLSSGLDVNGTDLVAGVNDVLGGAVPVTGGLAGDADRFERTWVLVDGKPVEHYVVAVGFYGTRIAIGHGSRGGWDKFGPERTITRANDNVLYELDGEPALELYQSYLGDLAEAVVVSVASFRTSTASRLCRQR